MPINKFTTLQDLARQAKIISGETATFDGKIQVGIPFSGYPTGVDTGTTVSLGVVSSEDAVFSGNSGTTIFDVANTGSTNYSPIFSGYSGSVWTNVLFSGNTSGLTLPITPLSADTQIVGPFWTLTQTGMTGDYVIGTQYTGYSITYSFFNVSQFGTGFTYSGFTTASQENFSAGTLDYKGPLDYISTKEDASVEGRLTTNKITITNGASASTIGYVLTQTGENGEGEWLPNSSADTNTYVTGGTLTLPSAGSNLILGWNTGGSANPIDLSSLEFTGNTSGDCITDLYVRRLYGCSPITVHDTITYNGSIIDSATTNSFIFGSNHVLTASSLTHGVNADANVILGGNDNRITPNSTGFYNTIIGGYGNEINGRINYASIIGATNSNISSGTLAPTTIIGGNSNTIEGSESSVIIGGEGNFIDRSDRTIILGGSGITGTTDDTVYVPNLTVRNNHILHSDSTLEVVDIPGSFGNNMKGSYTEFNWDGITTNVLSNSNSSGSTFFLLGNFSNWPTVKNHGFLSYYGTGYTRSSGLATTGADFYRSRLVLKTAEDSDGMIFSNSSPSVNWWWENDGNSRMKLTKDGFLGLGLNTDGSENPTANLQIGGTGTTGSFRYIDGNQQNGYVLTSDANGVGSWQASSGGGGVTIDPYYTEPSTLSVTWNVSGNSTNYQTVLTGNTTLNLSNVRNGDYGTIIVEQDGTGSHTLSFGTVNGAGGTHRVVNGGGGSPTLTSNPNAIDILSFTYNGSVMYWTVGNDYT